MDCCDSTPAGLLFVNEEEEAVRTLAAEAEVLIVVDVEDEPDVEEAEEEEVVDEEEAGLLVLAWPALFCADFAFLAWCAFPSALSTIRVTSSSSVS